MFTFQIKKMLSCYLTTSEEALIAYILFYFGIGPFTHSKSVQKVISGGNLSLIFAIGISRYKLSSEFDSEETILPSMILDLPCSL